MTQYWCACSYLVVMVPAYEKTLFGSVYALSLTIMYITVTAAYGYGAVSSSGTAALRSASARQPRGRYVEWICYTIFSATSCAHATRSLSGIPMSPRIISAIFASGEWRLIDRGSGPLDNLSPFPADEFMSLLW